jgi:hypothetical protein
MDWWATARGEIEEHFLENQAFAFIGARQAAFKLHMQPGERLTYRYADYGIPPGSRVLYVNYTPGGAGLFPAELHGNVPPTRRFQGDGVQIYPVPWGDKPSRTELSVLISWVPRTADDDSWDNLVRAFEAYAAKDYPAMIVPANVAVESSLTVLMTRYLEKFVSKNRTESFLQDAATYSHQLNVLLPLIASMSDIAKPPNAVLEGLNRLRSLRNDIAHDGVIKGTLDQKSAAQVLTAALFGVQYVRYIGAKLKV